MSVGRSCHTALPRVRSKQNRTTYVLPRGMIKKPSSLPTVRDPVLVRSPLFAACKLYFWSHKHHSRGTTTNLKDGRQGVTKSYCPTLAQVFFFFVVACALDEQQHIYTRTPKKTANDLDEQQHMCARTPKRQPRLWVPKSHKTTNETVKLLVA